MITARYLALDFSGRLILVINDLQSNVVRKTFLTFATGSLERILEFEWSISFLAGGLGIGVFLWSLWGVRPV